MATTTARTRRPVLVFRNISAHFNKDKDIIGQQDPYIIFELGDEHVTTDVKKSGGVNPSWEGEEYTLHEDTPASDIRIFVYNKNTLLPDQLLGHGSVPFNSVRNGGRQQVVLTDKKGRETGVLYFEAYEAGATTGAGAGAGAGYATSGQQEYTTAAAGGYGAGQHGTSAGYGQQAGYTGISTGMGAGGVGGGVGGITQGVAATNLREEVCDRQTFTRVEDRPVVRERVEYILEHHPVEKEFVVETKFAGERAIGGGGSEHLGTEVKVVSETPPSAPCEGAQNIGSQRVAGIQQGAAGMQQGTTGTAGHTTY